MLLRARGWTAVIVVSLALGTGANTALFSAVNGLLLRKLAVDEPDRLVRFRHVGRNEMVNSSSDYGTVEREGGLDTRTTVSYPMYQELRRANQTMTDMFAGAPIGSVHLVVDGRAEIATGFIASGNYHRMLGAASVLGRTLAPEDDHASAPPVVVLSEGFWSRRFGRDAGVLGKVVQANNTPVTIVGVTSSGFTGIQRVVSTAPDVTFPLALDTRLNAQEGIRGERGPQDVIPRLSQPTYWWLQVMGRLKPGATAEQVEANLGGVFQQTARQGMDAFLAGLPPMERGLSQNQNRTEVSRLRVSPGARGIYDNRPEDVRAVAILSVVVALILLIVCANIANLLLSRAAVRQKELSVRLSIGATRARLVRQLLTESVLLAFLGSGFGLVVAYWGKQLLPGQVGQAPLDWRVLMFATGLALLAGIVFGIVPALRATRTTVAAVLNENSRTVIASRTVLGKSLLVVQIAVSLVLLVGAGLFLRTVENLRRVDVGFNPRNLLLFRVNPQLNRYDPTRIGSLYDRMVERLEAVPGVQSATLSNPPLLSGSVNGGYFVVQGRPFTRGPHNEINRVRIAPNFFETMGIPLVAGRTLTPRDGGTAPKVAVINEAAARKFFRDESPLGHRFGGTPEDSGQIEVVGVVRDVKYNSVRDDAPPTMYVPYVQSPLGAMAFEIRTAGDPAGAVAAIREAVRQVDPTVPLTDVSTQVDQIERRFSQERVMAQACTLFGGLALLVASIGVFGLMSYSVARRTNEVGIRMALGAQREDVVRLVMGESMMLVAAGVAIGFVGVLAASRFVSNLLFGLEPADPLAVAGAVTVMVLVSAVAGYLPARRASRVDPMVALRCE
jgi:predicted permease